MKGVECEDFREASGGRGWVGNRRYGREAVSDKTSSGEQKNTQQQSRRPRA